MTDDLITSIKNHYQNQLARKKTDEVKKTLKSYQIREGLQP